MRPACITLAYRYIAFTYIFLLCCSWSDSTAGRLGGRYVALRFSFVANWSFQVVTLAVKPVAGSLGDAAPLVRDVTAQFLPHHGRRCVLFATSPDTPDMRALTAAVGHERINCVADAMNRLLTADSLGRVPAVVRLLVKCRALVAAVHFDSCACVDAQRELDVQRHVQLHTHTHTHGVHRRIRRIASPMGTPMGEEPNP